MAFALDPKTGILTVPPTLSAVTSPPLVSICSPDNPFGPPNFWLVGFNLSGTQIIDAWSCAGHDDSVGYYDTQAVNQSTGSLGRPVATVGTGSSEDEYTTVTFTPTAILTFQNEGFEIVRTNFMSRNFADCRLPEAHWSRPRVQKTGKSF
jgi:hypothetical protein